MTYATMLDISPTVWMQNTQKINQSIATEFDKFFSQFDTEKRKNSAYPPYNIIKMSDSRFLIELAVAGFTKAEIEISVTNNKLVITGRKKSDEIKAENVLYRGIATRNFSRDFTLSENVEVVSAELNDGLLIITLDEVVPDNKKTRTIEINKKTPSAKKDLLTE